MARERDEQGCFTEQLTDERILNVFEGEDEDLSVLSARQIADRLGFTRQAVDQRLRELQSENEVEKLSLGPRNVAWRRSTDTNNQDNTDFVWEQTSDTDTQDDDDDDLVATFIPNDE